MQMIWSKIILLNLLDPNTKFFHTGFFFTEQGFITINETRVFPFLRGFSVKLELDFRLCNETFTLLLRFVEQDEEDWEDEMMVRWMILCLWLQELKQLWTAAIEAEEGWLCIFQLDVQVMFQFLFFSFNLFFLWVDTLHCNLYQHLCNMHDYEDTKNHDPFFFGLICK